MPINAHRNKKFLDKPYGTQVVTMATQATGLPRHQSTLVSQWKYVYSPGARLRGREEWEHEKQTQLPRTSRTEERAKLWLKAATAHTLREMVLTKMHTPS